MPRTEKRNGERQKSGESEMLRRGPWNGEKNIQIIINKPPKKKVNPKKDLL